MGCSLQTIDGWVRKTQGNGRAAPKQNRAILYGEIMRTLYLSIPLEIHPNGSGPTSYSYNLALAKKKLQDEWVQVKNNDTKWYCFCSSTNFCSTWHVVGRYISPRFLISLLFRIWAFPACSDPVAQKRHHVVGLPAVSSFSPRLSVFKEQPILFVRKWAHYGSLILAAFFYNVDKEWSAHTHPFCPRAVSES